MDNLTNIFSYLNKNIYEPNDLIMSNLFKESFNLAYGAYLFNLNDNKIRFRVSKITPNKTGPFLSLWKKDSNNKNIPFSYEDFPDFLVVTSIEHDNIGQFIFPKSILLKKNILRSSATKGKMAFRVYPSWANPTTQQGVSSQKWQLKYFIDFNNYSSLELKNFYTKKDTYK